ncbi:MAG: NAD-binding protein [Pseudomonadota bacterium]
MRVVIAGATRLATVVVRQLIEDKHDVVVIDKDKAALERLGDTYDCGMIQGDATLPSTLRDAAGDEADILLALTNSDEDNILAALVGRSIGYQRVIPQIVETELTAVCEELALGEFLTPHATIARDLVASIDEGHAPEREAPLAGNFALTGYEVEGRLAGTRLGDLDLADGRVVAVTSEQTDSFADPDMTLEAGMRLTILADRKSFKKILATLSDADEEEGDRP